MTRTAAVEFTPRGRLFHCDAGDLDVRVGDKVLFPTEFGPEVATVAWPPTETDAAGLPVLAGLATRADLERDAAMRADKARCLRVAEALAADRGLPMKFLGVDVIDRDPELDRQVAFYFSAPGRVDFRQLVPLLARAVEGHIDLRQVGGREAAALVGDVGHCGLSLCCTTFLEAFEPISMRLAKLQDRSNNPLSITGACGRLLCCLAYEAEAYAEFARTAPAVGDRVETPQGSGVVVGQSLPLNAVNVRIPDGTVVACDVGDACPRRAAGRAFLPGPHPADG